MTEFWVSRKKYFCQYCECFITDDKPSRTHHENGQRHQGNKERYVRGIYKTGEKRKRELADEQREMAAINQVRN
jgi:WW domain-binding protein 4